MNYAKLFWVIFIIVQILIIWKLNKDSAGTDDFGAGILIVLLVIVFGVLDLGWLLYQLVQWLKM